MRTAGIISEYNPFHRGHAWQIGELRRRLGAETAVVCAMSGSFVQRGDFAVMRTHARAEAAVRGGADLVLELPLPWAIASAEGFAAGGVGVLAATGAVEVDVSVVQLSLEDEKALNLALNKISGQWDNEKLSAVLQDLSAGFDVEVTGFDQHEVDALVASFAESGHEYELPGSEPYINNFFDSGVQAKPKAEEPAAAPAPEAPAQDAEMHPNAAPAPNEVQAVQPGGKKTVIVPNLSKQDATTLVDVLKDMGFAYRLEDAA